MPYLSRIWFPSEREDQEVFSEGAREDEPERGRRRFFWLIECEAAEAIEEGRVGKVVSSRV